MNDTAIALHVLWGADPEDDLPATFTFSTEEAKAAFIKGMNEADGWMDVNWVSHAGFKVDRKGEVVELPGAAPSSSAHEVFALWGEKPETGSHPSSYAFATAAEAEAFKQGASEAAGWTTWALVPSAEHRRIIDTSILEDESEYTWLTPAGRRHLIDLLDQDELPETIVTTPQGAWADEAGTVGHAPDEPEAPSPRPSSSRRSPR